MTSILLFGLLAAAANVLGGLVLIKSGAHRLGERFLKYLVALGAGFMLAAIFIEILPTTIDIWTQTSHGSSASVLPAMTLLHKMPEGFTVASIMLAAQHSTQKALIATAAIGAATLAGVIGVTLLDARMSNAVGYALPFSAGVTLYVAASDLIPEVNHKEERNPRVSIVVFAGVALFYLLHRLIEG